MVKIHAVFAAFLALTLVGCNEEDQISMPAPVELSGDEIGHYCNMIVQDHMGPKAHLFVAGRDEPYWFTSVRDALAFTMLPEEPRNILVVYVNDMARASWDAPEQETWIDARSANFVVGSSRRGGMGALEVVPFSSEEAAASFVETYGGHMVAYSEVPRDYVLSSDDEAPEEDAMSHDHGDEEMRHDGS
jgi:copper chaperone NosL